MAHRRLYTPNAEGVFESPLGTFNPSTEDKWETMADYFEDILTRRHPNSVMIEAATDRKITYKKIIDRADMRLVELKTVSEQSLSDRHLFSVGANICSQLHQAGVGLGEQKKKKKTIVHIVGGNCLEWLGVMTGCYLRGDCVISATHPNSPWPEVSRNITTTCSTVLILTRKCYEKFADQIDHPFLTHVIVADVRGGHEGKLDEKEDYEVILSSSSKEQKEQPQYDSEELKDVCQMLLSSGTSGPPKAIKATAGLITYNILALASKGTFVYSPSDVSLVAQPLAHVGGQNFSFLSVTYHGPTLVVTDYPGSVGLLEMTQKYKMTHTIAVPAVLNFLAKYDQLEKYDLSTLKYILTGASKPNFDMISLLLKRANLTGKCTVKNAYGASELFGVAFITNDDLTTPLESVGISVPGVSFKIVQMDGEGDSDSSRVITEPNMEGEMLVKLPIQLPNELYFNDPQKTKDSFSRDGFYKTGDIAMLDEEWNVHICGRVKDVVKFRGFSISPAEIEEVLMESDLVMDCAVVPRPDETSGEVPVAFVVCSPNATSLSHEQLSETLISHVAGAVAEHKKLKGVYKIGQIPRNGNGKIVKGDLKQLLLN